MALRLLPKSYSVKTHGFPSSSQKSKWWQIMSGFCCAPWAVLNWEGGLRYKFLPLDSRGVLLLIPTHSFFKNQNLIAMAHGFGSSLLPKRISNPTMCCFCAPQNSKKRYDTAIVYKPPVIQDTSAFPVRPETPTSYKPTSWCVCENPQSGLLCLLLLCVPKLQKAMWWCYIVWKSPTDLRMSCPKNDCVTANGCSLACFATAEKLPEETACPARIFGRVYITLESALFLFLKSIVTASIFPKKNLYDNGKCSALRHS